MTIPPLSRPYIDPLAGELLERCATPRRALFLDRDGVINVDHGYVHEPDRTDWVPGVFDLCKIAHEREYLVIVVTNQAGIARGYYDETEFLRYSAWMHDEFRKRGAPLLATYYCPHHPIEGLKEYKQDCECRKPKPGMILGAKELFSIALDESVLIGDKDSDIGAGTRAGIAKLVKIEGSLPADTQSFLCELPV